MTMPGEKLACRDAAQQYALCIEATPCVQEARGTVTSCLSDKGSAALCEASERCALRVWTLLVVLVLILEYKCGRAWVAGLSLWVTQVPPPPSSLCRSTARATTSADVLSSTTGRASGATSLQTPALMLVLGRGVAASGALKAGGALRCRAGGGGGCTGARRGSRLAAQFSLAGAGRPRASVGRVRHLFMREPPENIHHPPPSSNIAIGIPHAFNPLEPISRGP